MPPPHQGQKQTIGGTASSINNYQIITNNYIGHLATFSSEQQLIITKYSLIIIIR